MTPRKWFGVLLVLVPLLMLAGTGTSDAQRHAVPRPPHPPRPPAHHVAPHAHVFIGGYFYDPFYGPYPWWPRTAYPRWYFPIYDRTAVVRLLVTPESAEVYVDGFYAGIVEDFDGVFQGLPLPAGGHSIVLYQEGYRTMRRNLYLRPGATTKVHETLAPLPPGVPSERPEIVPPVPPPPTGTYRAPNTPPRAAPPVTATNLPGEGSGVLDLRVQPTTALVLVDGQPWETSDEGRFMLQLAAGRHRVEISQPGYGRYATDIDVRDGQTVPLNVSLMPAR